MRVGVSRPALVFLVGLGCAAPAFGSDGEFDRSIAPILIAQCLDCHSGPKPKGGLDLSRRQTTFEGGKGGVVLTPGKPDESRLWQYVRTDKMPPKKPLRAEEKAVFRTWIAAGAQWGADPVDPFRVTSGKRAGYDWWALQPLAVRQAPDVGAAGAANPIDAFVIQRLRAHGLQPAAPADRRTLIRRLSFDLLGLPPTPDEINAFEQDPSADAYERLVDRLLASPAYGERWARHWLDVVRFGESNGFEFDEPRPSAWPYRDWVVNALNADLPYDEFVRLQLAGDVLRPENPDAVRATGFLVAGAYDSVGQMQQSEVMKRVVRQDELEDLVGVVSQTFLGLTANCARCHDHKFDPIRQVEYYRLTAALAGVRHGERPLPRDPAPARVYAVTPRQPETAHVLVRGDPAQTGPIVAAGGLAAVRGLAADFGLAADAPEGERRKRLAAWVTSPDNAAFARTIVNRLWQHHFGAGLVETPNDFGFNGGRPSHPELLDWLARELVRGDWRLKPLHRLIVTSATYRQASTWNAHGAHLDADNRLVWRQSPRRLEAEAVRDAVLCVAGRLDPRMGGPGYFDVRAVKAPGTAAMLYLPVERAGSEFDRRSLYRVWSRGGRNRFLDVFDCPDPSAAAPSRAVTTTPLQALALFNNAFVLRAARDFADRLRREAGDDPAAQVRRAYRLAYGRPPAADEAAEATAVVRAHGLAVLTRAIFNSSEFLYVD